MGRYALQDARTVLALVALGFGAGAGGCGSTTSGGAPAAPVAGSAGTGRLAGGGASPDDAGQANDAGPADAGRVVPRCGESGPTLAAGIASAPLRASPPVQLTETAQLLGPGLSLTLGTQQNVAAGLRWEQDRVFMLADAGFWDISTEAGARWTATSSLMVLAASAADLDDDGDQDLLLLTSDVNAAPSTDPTASPLVTRLAAWERSPEGLTERTEVLRFPYVILPLPYEVGDLDGDGDLDVAGYERGVPVGYLHDGAFGFTRSVLGEAAPAYEDKLLTWTHTTDRNRDGVLDLLVMTGEALELNVFVLLGDGAGKFGAPGPAVIVEAPLVPHGPSGIGFSIADVTGDGLEDVVTQDAQSSAETPILNLFVSESATSIAPAVQLEGLGFEFADVNADGTTDIVTTRHERLLALLARGDGSFDARDLGISMSKPMLDFVVGFASDGAPMLHALYDLSACPACAGCMGRCLFDSCVACLSDADCATGRCEDQACTR
jgi:hypothetical protein